MWESHGNAFQGNEVMKNEFEIGAGTTLNVRFIKEVSGFQNARIRYHDVYAAVPDDR